MNRGAALAGMNAFLYSMKLRGLKHGSEEEYDIFEDLAVCRARNRRTNGAADSKLQLQHIVEDHEITHQHVERGQDQVEVEIEEESKCCGEDDKQGGDNGRESGGDPSTPIKDTKVLQIMIQVNNGVQQQTKCNKPNDPQQAKPDTTEQP